MKLILETEEEIRKYSNIFSERYRHPQSIVKQENVIPIHSTRRRSHSRHKSHVYFDQVMAEFRPDDEWVDAELIAKDLGCSVQALYMHHRRNPNILDYANKMVRKIA
jgi:hypothetical protein